MKYILMQIAALALGVAAAQATVDKFNDAVAGFSEALTP